MSSLKKTTGIYDAASDLSDVSNIDLTLIIGPFALSFLLKNEARVLAYESYEAVNDNLPWFSQGLGDLNKIELIQKKFRKIHVLLENPDYTFIPNEEFDGGMLKQYMDFNTDLQGAHHYAFDSVDKLSFKIIYALPLNVHAHINNFFPEASVMHVRTALLRYVSQQPQATEKLYVLVKKGSFDIFAFKDNAFQLGNTFSYNTAQDFIYFLMFVVKQLGFDNNELRLELGGHVEKDSTIYNFVYKYIRHISFVPTPEETVFSEAFEDMPPHFFINFLV